MMTAIFILSSRCSATIFITVHLFFNNVIGAALPRRAFVYHSKQISLSRTVNQAFMKVRIFCMEADHRLQNQGLAKVFFFLSLKPFTSHTLTMRAI